jgi:fructose-specific phosphotransferase system IIC component
MKLNIKAFALAAGLVWGINWFAVTWWMIILDGNSPETFLVGKMYRGYTISPIGSLIGFLWGFLDGFLIGLMVAWIYNKVAPRFRQKEE